MNTLMIGGYIAQPATLPMNWADQMVDDAYEIWQQRVAAGTDINMIRNQVGAYCVRGYNILPP